ncbi:hypothetical protein FS749_007378 [Ceratobasidium sp. UAMH 11750]|nr:hypothetical protein FS749_007378 [Ceratobasidium sp. UAMH 11750]
MLQLAGSKSADMNNLCISPRGFGISNIRKDADLDSLPRRQLEFFSSFASFRKLRRLRSNIAILYPRSILVLSELPCLEELLVGVDAAPPLCYDISPPETAFPSFRTLVLENVRSPHWIMDLWSVRAMFKNLETISVAMWPGVHEPEHVARWADAFLSRLCSHSPRLSDLSILFNGGDDDEDPFSLSQDVEESFRLLPLRSLTICDAYFEGEASLADLACFAQNLPNLEKLQLNLELGGSNIPALDRLSPSSPRHTTFRRLCFDSPRQFKRSSAQTEKLAEYLHFLWPNIQCSHSSWDHIGAEMAHRNFMNFDERRGLNELKVLDLAIERLRTNGH